MKCWSIILEQSRGDQKAHPVLNRPLPAFFVTSIVTTWPLGHWFILTQNGWWWVGYEKQMKHQHLQSRLISRLLKIDSVKHHHHLTNWVPTQRLMGGWRAGYKQMKHQHLNLQSRLSSRPLKINYLMWWNAITLWTADSKIDGCVWCDETAPYRSQPWLQEPALIREKKSLLFLLHVGSRRFRAVWSVGRKECSVKCEGISGKWEVWSVECEVWSVKFQFGVWRAQCEVWSVKCEVWSVKEAVWSVKCEVWSVKFEVWSAKSAVWSVECEDFASSLAEKIKRLSREGHGRDRVSLNYRSFMFGKLPPPACPGLC